MPAQAVLGALGIDDPAKQLFSLVEGLVASHKDKKERLVVVKSTSAMMAYLLGEFQAALRELPDEHVALATPMSVRMIGLSRAQHLLAAATADLDGDLLEQIQRLRKISEGMQDAGVSADRDEEAPTGSDG